MDSPPQAGVRWAPVPQARLPELLPGASGWGTGLRSEKILDPNASEQERALPPITPDNVSSIASDSFKRQLCGDKKAHVSWARMECGLVL